MAILVLKNAGMRPVSIDPHAAQPIPKKPLNTAPKLTAASVFLRVYFFLRKTKKIRAIFIPKSIEITRENNRFTVLGKALLIGKIE